MNDQIKPFFSQVKLPSPESHKGQNGKLLIIGGSDLFHAASKWSLDIASKFVDMVFYSSVPQNNELIREAKSQFWNGIIVPREEVETYLNEADCILIGPGMERSQETARITNHLLAKYADKRWVIDAGALQMVEPKLLNSNCIITPHRQELLGLLSRMSEWHKTDSLANEDSLNKELSLQVLKPLLDTGVTVLLKGHIDQVFQRQTVIHIEGGNAGMTKGGTGDVLAGLVAALYCHHENLVASVVGSYANKKAGDKLYQEVGPYFNASDLVTVIPEVLWHQLRSLV